ncbi:helix-turn-helix domain-containing protein [Xanthomonas massiliensis]|uniref:helix-turn-helix domain-containing protein n=1 Tax=Xanthomonas massiliensis TaxID=1720302 RepID=UPI00191809AD|nr:helix-turn-helix transcriptional regulator [Xanthomonas massiliensis]
MKYALAEEAVQVRADRQNVAKAFGQALRQSRERAGMSQEELAHLASVDRTFVSRAERGVCQPALATVLLLAGALKVPAATLVASTEKVLKPDL